MHSQKAGDTRRGKGTTSVEKRSAGSVDPVESLPAKPVPDPAILAEPGGPGEASATVEAARSGYLGKSAPPISAPPTPRRWYIDRPNDLVAVCRDLEGIKVLALDAEFSQSSLRAPEKPTHSLSLLQLAIDQGMQAAFVIDAQRLSDLSPLQEPFQNDTTLKLFHSIGSDAKVLAARGLVAANTVDLEAVSRTLFGQREAGLQSMLYRASGIWLDKSFQRADWSHRPLSPRMLAYAAQDAEMTLLLYRWLEDNYSWVTDLHHTPAGETSPDIADWILAFIEGPRQRHGGTAVTLAGISTDITLQEEALRSALAKVHHPPQRARVMRLITDLELTRLAPDLYPYLGSPASEERQGAARGLGRLHDRNARALIQLLQHDSVQEVRQAANLALEQLEGKSLARSHPPSYLRPPDNGASAVRWSSDSGEAGTPVTGGWQEALRIHFAVPTPTGEDESPDDDATDESVEKSE
jgi:hypothetical protein